MSGGRHGNRYQLEGGMIAFRWNNQRDVRSYKPPRGFDAVADLIEYHPATSESLGESQWWMFLNRKEAA